MGKIKHYRFPTEIILQCVRWYLSYNLSYRDLESITKERGITVSYESIRKLVVRFSSLYDALRRKHQTKISLKWRVDETYIKINNKWYYYYRAIDSFGQVIDFYLSPRRNMRGAVTFFNRCIRTTGCEPEKVISDKHIPI